MINLGSRYAGSTGAASTRYPLGEFQNDSSASSTNGTPIEQDFLNDVNGLLQAALALAGIVANGNPDSVENPQILSALQGLGWSQYVEYRKGARAWGSDGELYIAQAASGPSTTARNPVSAGAAWWLTEAAHLSLKQWPVGAVYTSHLSTDPATLFGGTWLAVGPGRMLITVDPGDAALDAAGKTGGSKTHQHSIPITGYGSATESGGLADPSDDGRLVTGSGNNESSEFFESLAHAETQPQTAALNHLPPYQAVYMWRRTA